MSDVVHLSVPLRIVGTQLAYEQQDSQAEIEQCVFAILNTRVGHRIDLPEFGLPDQTHRVGGADLDEIERTVHLWEERADLRALHVSGRLDELAATTDLVELESAS